MCIVCISITPKYAVVHVVGYIKDKSAIKVARQFGGRKRNFPNNRGQTTIIDSKSLGEITTARTTLIRYKRVSKQIIL